MMKFEYIIGIILGVIGCIYYYCIETINRKLQDYIVIIFSSAGIILGLKTAWFGIYSKDIKVPSDIRVVIFIGGIAVFLISLYAGTEVLKLNLNLYN